MSQQNKNPMLPCACKILSITKETGIEWTFRIESSFQANHGQFMQLSIPKTGEAPISISGIGDGYMDFTLRAVGKVTNEIFEKQVGDYLYLRGPYGNGWPCEKLEGKHLIFITGGTGLAPVRSLLNKFYNNMNLVKSVTLISGFKNKESILFKNELVKWKEKFKTFYTLDNDNIKGWNSGLVTNFIKEIDFTSYKNNYALIVVGPPIMMKFTGLELEKHNVPDENIWMSFERKMSCAIGKCGHCRIDETYVCLDGPIFPYKKAKKLID